MTQAEITILNELVMQRDRLSGWLPPALVFLRKTDSLPADISDLAEPFVVNANAQIKAEIQNRVDAINATIAGIGVSDFPASSEVSPAS